MAHDIPDASSKLKELNNKISNILHIVNVAAESAVNSNRKLTREIIDIAIESAFKQYPITSKYACLIFMKLHHHNYVTCDNIDGKYQYKLNTSEFADLVGVSYPVNIYCVYQDAFLQYENKYNIKYVDAFDDYASIILTIIKQITHICFELN